MEMGKKIIQVPADDSLIEMLDEVRGGRPRAEVMRQAFMLYFDLLREKELDETYSAGYRDTPEDTNVSAAQEEMLEEVLTEESW